MYITYHYCVHTACTYYILPTTCVHTTSITIEYILRFKNYVLNFVFKFYTMYFISYTFNPECIFIGCINFSSWLGLASMVFVFNIYCT